MRWAIVAALQYLWMAAALAAEAATGLAPEAYLLQPGDVVMISVWKEPDLQVETLIRPDGRLSFALAGEVQAAQRSVEDLRADLEARVRKLIPEATVTVTVRALSGNRVYVIGKVAKPGDFALLRPTDVLQALTTAGGMTPFADGDGILILRRVGGHQVVLPFHYSDVEHGRRLQQNILLQSGDTVVVP